MALKYKEKDRVRIKSLDWYNENKDEYGYVDCGSRAFFTKMSDWCGKIVTIKEICKTNCYRLEEYDFDWTDEMIEGLVEETITTNEQPFKPSNISLEKEMEWNLPNGYIFKDENGNIINTTKIVLKKKKKEYPKTYEECCELLSLGEDGRLYTKGYKASLIQNFQKLLICRDTYWKIAGEEMKLGKPWEPDWKDGDQKKYCIYNDMGDICKSSWFFYNAILAFPTPEMRDAFYENFKNEIEICKELL